MYCLDKSSRKSWSLMCLNLAYRAAYQYRVVFREKLWNLRVGLPQSYASLRVSLCCRDQVEGLELSCLVTCSSILYREDHWFYEQAKGLGWAALQIQVDYCSSLQSGMFFRPSKRLGIELSCVATSSWVPRNSAGLGQVRKDLEVKLKKLESELLPSSVL